MQQNSKFSPDAAAQILKTSEGQQLAQLLNHADPERIRQATKAMQHGDAASAAAILGPILQNQEIQALLQKIQGGRKNG